MTTETSKPVTEKDWLDLAWKCFQQHAQQRISYFNFFVIFSTILTTGFLSTFQNTYKLHYLGIGIGLLQTFVSIIFLKIDLRNKFLTRNAEEAIKIIEKDFDTTVDKRYSLFTRSTILAEKLRSERSFFLFKQWQHSTTYVLFYVVFMITGLAMSVFTAFLSFKHLI